VSIAFAKEGADVASAYLSEHDDARRTVELVEAEVLAPVGGETMPG
jgi:hypothetical protein